jgi:dTDP-4-dehydrorhamnose 3,5-epimerase-like enzyme
MNVNGIKIEKLKVIKNQDGDILKFLSKKNKFFNNFGEIYFSKILKGKIKGWNYHKTNTCIICVPNGKVKFIFKFKKRNKSIIISDKNKKILIIYPKTWFSFSAVNETSLIANVINKIHSKYESIKIPITS